MVMISMLNILYDREDITERGFTEVFSSGHMAINGRGYTLVNQEGKLVKRFVHSAIVDPDALFVSEGEPCDLVDDRYLEVYRMIGRADFLELIRNNPMITPDKAQMIADRIQMERRSDVIK